MELVIAFILGAVVMDFIWAWALGIPQVMFARWKYRKVIKQMEQEQS